MSNVKDESDVSGMLGESATIRKVQGKVVVKNRPRRRLGRPSPFPKDSAKRDAVKAKFREAAQYGRQQVSLPESKVMYAQRVTEKKRSAYAVAMSDYLIAPIVHDLETVDYHGAIGDPIMVKATDDFMVTKVKIVITNAAGALLEEGDATPDVLKINLWEYKATAANPALVGTKIRAIAYDRPGNKGTAEIVL